MIQGDIFILRGLPGTGKTTLALFLSEVLPNSVIISADDFFTNDNGEYNFEKEKIQEAHKETFELFKNHITAKKSTIIVDNTNIKAYHFYHYIDYAQRYDYRVSVITIPHNDVSDKELSDRTPHGIDRGLIRKMRKDFEWQMF